MFLKDAAALDAASTARKHVNMAEFNSDSLDIYLAYGQQGREGVYPDLAATLWPRADGLTFEEGLFMSAPGSTVPEFFRRIVTARDGNVFIRRESRQDKEFHFQNWVKARLQELKVPFDEGGRNTYLVLCHGDFLNADHEYVHKNKAVRGFGSYGDILIRDRKMYVVPTPFALARSLAHFFTLIMPDEDTPGPDFDMIGELLRIEAADLVVSYRFDLRTNDLTPDTVPNPHAGREHRFRAWRLKGEGGDRKVEMTPRPERSVPKLLDQDAENE
jgi:hypothetical protein